MKLTYETQVRSNPAQILLPRFTVSQIMRNDQQVSFRIFFTANHDTFDKNDYIVVKYAKIDKYGCPLTNKGVIQYFKPKTRPVPPSGSKDTIIFGKLQRKEDGTYDIDWGNYETSVVEEPPLDEDSSSDPVYRFYASTCLERQAVGRSPSETATGQAVMDALFASSRKTGNDLFKVDRTPDLDSTPQRPKKPPRTGDQHREVLETLSAVSSAENLSTPSEGAYRELAQQDAIQEARRQYDKIHNTPNSIMPSVRTITGTDNHLTPHSITTPYTVLTDGKVAWVDENGVQASPTLPVLNQTEQTQAALALAQKTTEQSEISQAENSQQSTKTVVAMTDDEALSALNQAATEAVTDSAKNPNKRPSRDEADDIYFSNSSVYDDLDSSTTTSSSDTNKLPSSVPGDQDTLPDTDSDHKPEKSKLKSRFQKVYTVARSGDDLSDLGGGEELSDEFLANYDSYFRNMSEEDVLKLDADLQWLYAQWVVKRKPILDAESNTEQNTEQDTAPSEPPDSSEPSVSPIPPSHIEPFINHFAPGYDTVTGDLVWKVGFGFSGSFDTFPDYVRYITDSICKRVQTEVTRRPGGNGKIRKIDKYEIIDAAGVDAQKRLYFRSNPGYVYCYWGHSTPRMIRLLQAPYFFRNHHCSQLYWYLVCSTANSTEIKDDTYRILIGRHGFVNRAQETVIDSRDSITIPGNSFFNPMWVEIRDENDELYPLQVPYILEWTFSPIKPA